MTKRRIERVSYSVYQFAERHGVTAPTIYDEIYSGRLPAMYIGKHDLRITKQHETAWLRRRAAEVKSHAG
jgi:hypothetical protein